MLKGKVDVEIGGGMGWRIRGYWGIVLSEGSWICEVERGLGEIEDGLEIGMGRDWGEWWGGRRSE